MASSAARNHQIDTSVEDEKERALRMKIFLYLEQSYRINSKLNISGILTELIIDIYKKFEKRVEGYTKELNTENDCEMIIYLNREFKALGYDVSIENIIVGVIKSLNDIKASKDFYFNKSEIVKKYQNKAQENMDIDNFSLGNNFQLKNNSRVCILNALFACDFDPLQIATHMLKEVISEKYNKEKSGEEYTINLELLEFISNYFGKSQEDISCIIDSAVDLLDANLITRITQNNKERGKEKNERK